MMERWMRTTRRTSSTASASRSSDCFKAADTCEDELFALGHYIDEFDQVTYILDGLPEEYDPIVMNVTATNQSAPVSIAYVHGLLLNMETRIARHRSSSHSPSEQTTTVL
ncbi:hypothetical protein MRB53_020651 [Persea americana]|uniref:Uncharacterized protein n=1 Tax=Persea americana TaxID=3435 RepID=A0ACC2L2S8_PERAE|nr:hypothetical protein MRB53_020651 [Persea americana]